MVLTTCQINGCNYVQTFEGLLDSSHLSVLHSSAIAGVRGQDINLARAISHTIFDTAPELDSEMTDFGLHYAAVRMLAGKAETRIGGYVAPFWSLNPNGDMWFGVVPMTDEKTALYCVSWDRLKQYGADPLRSQQLNATGFTQEKLEAFGQTRRTFGGPNTPARLNGFRQDRAMMNKGHFSGVPTIALEDSLVTMSVGPLRDRSQEKLSSADVAIMHFYRSLLKSAKQVRDGGKPVGYGLSLAKLRGASASLEPGTEWRSLVPDHFRVNPISENQDERSDTRRQ